MNLSEGDGSEDGETEQTAKFSPGLTLEDVDAIREVVPTVHMLSPEITLNSYVIQGGKRASAKLLGVSNEYFEIFNLPLYEGVPSSTITRRRTEFRSV